ncbi:MAG TPA: FAD-dependent oxidoreductase [Gaiellaceae bacterium]|nr:FAD-dependent oxidoreductase [Gaiellaceae bacterium]
MTVAPSPFAELTPPLEAQEAVVEADRCLECGGAHADAPCVVACPADVDVPSFVAAIAGGDAVEAARVIFSDNLLGGTCARVCPVELLCQGACVLPHDGARPIEIGRLQRYATDVALGERVRLRTRAPFNWLRVSVIGAGPAGLTAAGELAALGYDVTVYDERLEPGGLVRYAIAPYRQQSEPLPSEARVLHELGVHFELGIAVDSPGSLAELEAESDAIVLAVGMGPDVDVAYPGDDLPGVWESLPFIEALKTGEPPHVGASVAVIGGGNTAIDVAREAVRLGADDVTLVYRRTAAEMPAYPHEVLEAREEGVQIEWLTIPVRFVGRERLEGIECRRAELGEPDAGGRRRPHEIEGSEFVIPCETAVKAIGQRPRAEFLAWIEGLELDDGHIVVDGAGRTTNPKYFAAGDACNGGATVVEAVRAAKVAARGVHESLNEGWS